MIALCEGVTSDRVVHEGVQYLARIDKTYMVVTPYKTAPYREAVFFDLITGRFRSFLELHEVAQIF